MKVLHTSDWHVGKLLRGRSRIAEHRAVLGEVAEIAQREKVDLVLVVGDLFETPAPPPEATAVVFDALLALRETGAHVVVGERFSASRYWREAAECGATVAQTLPPMTAMLKALPASAEDRQHNITRMYNWECWIYGSDPAANAAIVTSGDLPEDRSGNCEEEFQNMTRGWQQLLGPHLRKPN